MAALNAADMFQGTLALYTPTMMSDFLNHEDFDDYDTSVSDLGLAFFNTKF